MTGTRPISAHVVAANTWTDARWTFDRFARRFADKLNSTDPG